MKSWWVFVCCLTLTCQHANTIKVKENVFLEMSDLKELCPYSSFCGQNASAEFQYSQNYRPCCRSCSCLANCGLRGNCCFEELNQYNAGNDMICRHTFPVEPRKYQGFLRSILKNAPHYRMIDICSYSDKIARESGTKCEQNSSNVERSLSPMFSPTKGLIYINAHCAECNNVSDAVPWRRAIMCPSEAEAPLSEFMDNFNGIEISSDYSGCLLYYIPPPEVNLDILSCYPSVIRQCNTTGRMKRRDLSWNFCEMFNATFTIETVGHLQAYANVFCFMCNTVIDRNRIKEMQCTKQKLGSKKSPIVPYAPLSIILDLTDVKRSSISRRYYEKTHCPENSVMVASFTTICRPLKCKMGQLLINNTCDYYSREWIGGPFAVMLRLSPLNKDTFLQSSFFRDMSTQNKNDGRARWIRRKTLKQWKFLVLYHPFQNQFTSVEYIIVKTTYPSNSVDPHFLMASVSKALEDVWEINYLNSTFYFKVSLNEYFKYDLIFHDDILSMGIMGINIHPFKFAYYPELMKCILNIDYEFMLFPVSDMHENELDEGFFVTKLFFCEQIDLLPEEVSYYNICPAGVFFKVKNVTLHTFSRVTLPGATLNTAKTSTTFPTLDGMTVRVCVDEFEQNTSVSTSTSVHILGVCALVYKTIKYL
ncbi:uncharacterized protein LOC123539283 [Mercenaria mercenaria]|uniref:uncharacterized protein LOC123539283 n=1 Tax=Mercenaria mercenaria TaxID=6596 RepID=UPI00234F4E3E|nr:uncharacterized protein LOC123539283 [Mercenaria mercenaria]